MDKRRLREEMKGRLRSLAAEDRAARSGAACLRAAGTEAFQRAERIFCYAALPGELDTEALIHLARAAGKTIAFPRCLPGGEMVALVPLDEDAWEKGAYGIWEPIPARSGVMEDIDLAIVPGLDFDRAGNRLGRGAGYYDRFLARRGAVRMGLCFSFQLLPALPVESHDVVMDWVVTEGETLKLGVCRGGKFETVTS